MTPFYSSEEFWAMYISMTQQTNEDEEDLLIVKSVRIKKSMIYCKEKPWLIHVPAAAVIHEWRALFAVTERIAYVDVKLNAQLLLLFVV
jgi:hypothetical protein